MKKIFFIIIYLSTFQTFGQTWQLIWEDHFDNQATFESRFVVNNNAYSDDPDGNPTVFLNSNVQLDVQAGYLRILTRVFENPIYINGQDTFIHRHILPANVNTPYYASSGLVTTDYGHEVKYGRIEARIKMDPHGDGYWPAFWTMNPYGSEQIPLDAGEIDIMEVMGNGNTSSYTTTAHYSYNPEINTGPENHNAVELALLGVPNFKITDWHLYGVEWGPNTLRWTCDGKVVFEEENHVILDYVQILLSAMVNQDHYDENSDPWPVKKMEVDYVKYYKNICGSNPVINFPFGSTAVLGDNITFQNGAYLMYDKHAVATQQVTLKPDFWTNGYNFSAKIEPEICVHYGGLRLGNSSEENNSIEEKIASKYSVYPNPNNGQFTIEVPETDELVLIDVYDLMGKSIVSEMFTGTKRIIDISEQPKGIYLLKTTIGNRVYNEKIVYH